MIIFHEGLPGSGKSYEAMVKRIVPALQKGRAVDAYIEGLNHELIAQAAGIELDKCRELLVSIERDQVQQIPKLSRDNALIILDEAQNFWGNRAKLSEEVTQFVTEHRHRGQDIVLMGQDIRDVHAVWRRRVEIKACFLKLSAIGREGNYSVTTFRHTGGDNFQKVATSFGKYDKKYFGTYASHVSDDTNAENYKDGRASVLAIPGIRYLLPVALVAAVMGAFYIKRFFSPESSPLLQGAKPAVSAASESVPGGRPPPSPAAASGPASPASGPDVSVQEAYFAKLSEKYRVRLAGMITVGKRTSGQVEFVDGGARVQERLSFEALRDLGVSIIVSEQAARLYLGNWQALATMWPVEAEGKVSQARLEEMRVATAAPVQAGPTVIGGRATEADTSHGEPVQIQNRIRR